MAASAHTWNLVRVFRPSRRMGDARQRLAERGKDPREASTSFPQTFPHTFPQVFPTGLPQRCVFPHFRLGGKGCVRACSVRKSIDRTMIERRPFRWKYTTQSKGGPFGGRAYLAGPLCWWTSIRFGSTPSSRLSSQCRVRVLGKATRSSWALTFVSGNAPGLAHHRHPDARRRDGRNLPHSRGSAACPEHEGNRSLHV